MAGTERRNTVAAVLSRLMIAAGVACMLTPFVWSWRADVLQKVEQRSALGKKHQSAFTKSSKPKILIPKIGLDAVIVQETRPSDLDKGPMHLADTGEPGKPGNCCIAAHKEKWFRKLKQLEAGDRVTIRSKGTDHVYIVTEHRVVRAGQVSELDPTPLPTLTLITCTGPAYFGRGNGRLIVKASLLSKGASHNAQ